MDDALSKLNENFLSCNICTEIFKDPCTIGCQHTFCKVCLTRYTKTCREAISDKSILCPNCRQMTKVPRPQEPVDQWSQQFKPSFLIQGLLDTFTSQGSSDPVEDCCFACQKINKTTQAKSVCEDCDILLCEACATIHRATPALSGHVISPLGAGSTTQLKKRKVMCIEHNCVVDFCCKDCQKAVCHKCCIVYHRKCHSVVTLESMIPEMKQLLQQNSDQINSHIQQTGNTLKSRRSQVEEIKLNNFSLQSEIRGDSQQAVDLIRRKEWKCLDELDTLTEKQTEQLRSQIKSEEIDLQTHQQYSELLTQVMHSNSHLDMFAMYTLCLSGEITAEIQRHEIQEDQAKRILFEKHLDLDQLDKTVQLGRFMFVDDKADLQDTPKLLSTVNARTKDDTETPYLTDIEVFNIRGIDTLVITDFWNNSVKSCYTMRGTPHCTSLKLPDIPKTLTKIGQDRVAVSHQSHNCIELIKLTPDPVLVSSNKTKKKYTCLTALSDTTLAAGCGDPPSIDVLDLSGRVLRSVITPSTDRLFKGPWYMFTTPSTGQQLIQQPMYMCTTRQGHIVVTEGRSGSVCCVTQQGKVVYTYKLRGRGVTTTDTGSVIVVGDNKKIIQLTERGEYVRNLLTWKNGIFTPLGVCVHENKLYVTEANGANIKIVQL